MAEVQRQSFFKQYIHHAFEDCHWPTQQRFEDAEGDTRFWVLADGHGGEAAGQFFVKETVKGVKSLMSQRSWDFENPLHRDLFQMEIKEHFHVSWGQTFLTTRARQIANAYDINQSCSLRTLNTSASKLTNIANGHVAALQLTNVLLTTAVPFNSLFSTATTLFLRI
jgi:serine/threonine protein phosphatase PrpC